MKETLCWTCEFCTGVTRPNPNPNDTNKFFVCPWASRCQPVPGWKAKKTELKVVPNHTTTSYLVESCPYYVADLEAKIAAMDYEQIARRLETSISFVRRHLKLSRQVLYIYTNKYNKMAKIHFHKTGEKYLPAKDRYDLKKDIIKDILLLAQEEIAELTGDSSDDIKYNRALKQIIPDCQEMLKQVDRWYKMYKAAHATTTAN